MSDIYLDTFGASIGAMAAILLGRVARYPCSHARAPTTPDAFSTVRRKYSTAKSLSRSSH
jgi:hypothetical protein